MEEADQAGPQKWQLSAFERLKRYRQADFLSIDSVRPGPASVVTRVSRVLADIAKGGGLDYLSLERQDHGHPIIPEWFLTLPSVKDISDMHPDASPEATIRIVISHLIAKIDNDDLRRLAVIKFGLYPDFLPEDARRFAQSFYSGFSDEEIRLLMAQDLINGLRPSIESGSPVVNEDIIREITAALMSVVRQGLPVTPDTASPALIKWCLGADVTGLSAGDVLALIANTNSYISAQLDKFEIDKWALAARILFAHEPGTKGLNITERRLRAAGTFEGNRRRTSRGGWQKSTMDPTAFRKGVEPKIISAFAWQIYRAKS